MQRLTNGRHLSLVALQQGDQVGAHACPRDDLAL